MNNRPALSHGLQIRWINGQCFEFKFSNGKTLLTDPWYSLNNHPEHPLAKVCPQGFSLENLEGADYIFLNHTHVDHIYNLQEVQNRFNSTVITHSATAMDLAEAFDIPLTSVYPVDYNSSYYFDGFKLNTYHGTHHAQGYTLEKYYNRKVADARRNRLSAMGSLFNTNFELTTDEGLRIAFIGGDDDGMPERFKVNGRPNIVIRNKMRRSEHMDNVAEEWANFFKEANVQLLIPMHHEKWISSQPEFAENVFKEMDEIMIENGLIGRVAPLIRGKWYTIDLSITPM